MSPTRTKARSFSLRELFLFLTAIAGWLGWLAHQVRSFDGSLGSALVMRLSIVFTPLLGGALLTWLVTPR